MQSPSGKLCVTCARTHCSSVKIAFCFFGFFFFFFWISQAAQTGGKVYLARGLKVSTFRAPLFLLAGIKGSSNGSLHGSLNARNVKKLKGFIIFHFYCGFFFLVFDFFLLKFACFGATQYHTTLLRAPTHAHLRIFPFSFYFAFGGNVDFPA